MLLKILKKDMRRRKGVNLILFLFITLATVFLASSVGNIVIVSSAVEYYMDYANIPAVNIVTNGISEQEEIIRWMSEQKDIKEFGRSTFLVVSEKDIKLEKDGKLGSYTANSDSLYLDTADTGFCKVFAPDGKEVDLKPGEIAMTKSAMEQNHLQVGDKLHIKYGTCERKLNIIQTVKDAAYGNDMVGMNRFIIHTEDYELFAKEVQTDAIDVYYIATDHDERVSKDFNDQGFGTGMNTILRDTYKLVYSFDMILAAMLIVIGVCLILIAMLVLRFTLVFTLEEEYREIGIMKAVGLRAFTIKKIYLVKYLAIVLAGSMLGLLASVPVSSVMIKSVEANMIMAQSSSKIWINILCAVLIVLLVMLFCYNCTRKLNKISAMEAIKNGQTGERFKKRGGIRLYKRKRMPVVCFLGLNDVRAHLKRYFVLLITFCISFVLITIPLNTVTTMQSKEMITKFSLDPKSAAYVGRINEEGTGIYQNQEELSQGMERLQMELKQKGFDAKLSVATMYFLKYQGMKESENKNIITMQLIGENNQFQEYSEGTAPKLSNEIAFSEKILEDNNWKIGDTVSAKVDGHTQKFIITGSYSDYMQLGESARMNKEVNMRQENMMDYWYTMLDMKTNLTQQEMVKKLKKALPDYEWSDAQTIVNKSIGGIKDTLDDMVIPMTAMLCIIVMLMTVLMEKLFVAREKGEIAMMKSIGFRNSQIRAWQVLRMICVVLVSMVLAVPLSLFSNYFVLKPIFKIMGADVAIQVIPWKVYGTYPGVLLLGIIVATVFAVRGAKKINIREQNNLE